MLVAPPHSIALSYALSAAVKLPRALYASPRHSQHWLQQHTTSVINYRLFTPHSLVIGLQRPYQIQCSLDPGDPFSCFCTVQAHERQTDWPTHHTTRSLITTGCTKYSLKLLVGTETDNLHVGKCSHGITLFWDCVQMSRVMLPSEC